MKKLPLLGLGLLLAGHSYAQQGFPAKSDIAVSASFGPKIFSSYHQQINGGFEGLELSYRQNINFIRPGLFRYWSIGVYNTDQTRLMFGKDTTTRGSFGANYGLALGIGLNMLTTKNNFRITLEPSIAFDYNGTVNPFITRHVNPVGRMMLKINTGIAEISLGSSYMPTTSIRSYYNKLWVGLGVTQKWL